MNKEDLIIWLIAHYSYCLNGIDKLSFKKAIRFLTAEDTDWGICLVADRQFGVSLRRDKWVDKYVNQRTSYWYARPVDCKNLDEIKDTIRYRLKILNKELKSHPNE